MGEKEKKRRREKEGGKVERVSSGEEGQARWKEREPGPPLGA